MVNALISFAMAAGCMAVPRSAWFRGRMREKHGDDAGENTLRQIRFFTVAGAVWAMIGLFFAVT